jgi:hypothetical protein
MNVRRLGQSERFGCRPALVGAQRARSSAPEHREVDAGLEQQRKELVKLVATERAQDILDGFDGGPRAASPTDPASPFDQEFLDQRRTCGCLDEDMIGLARLRIATLVGVIVCTGCAAEPDTRAHGEATLWPALVPQRVNAVVRRQARQLLYLETEHQSFVTTPEHPFATVDAGWIRAGELAPGDRVISAKFGSLRVSSVRIETRAQPVPVFNLRVERAHAYWVGGADVLVHNTGCGPREDTVTRNAREVEEIERKLAELKNGEASSSSEQPLDRKNKIEALEAELKKAKSRLASAKHRAREKTQPREDKDKTQPREDDIARKSSELEKARRDLEALETTVPTSSEHAHELKEKIAELKSKLDKLRQALYKARHTQKRKTQPELIRQRPSGSTNQGPSRIPGEDNVAHKSREIQQARRDLEALETTVPTSSEHAHELKEKIAELKSNLRHLNGALSAARYRKKQKTQQPELITPRPREILRGDALEAALAAERTELHELQRRTDSNDPGPPGPREAQLRKLVREHTYDLKKEAELRELENRLAELEKVVPAPPELASEKAKLERMIHQNKRAANARRIQRKRAEDPGRAANRREQSVAERAREILDGFDAWQHGALPADPTSPVDQEFADQLLSEMLNEQAAREEQLEQDTADVDEEVRLINDLLAGIPSPPPGEVSEAVARLSGELQEERAQFNDNNFALVNEHAFLSSTLGHDNPAAARRMAVIQSRIQELKRAWQENTQKRLDETRKLLRDMQGNPRLRDETLEAELAEQIGLLEHELAHPP